MTTEELVATARALVSHGRGILAIDESTPTCNRRFEALGIQPIEENRRLYRELLVSGESLAQYVAGAILYDETIRQTVGDGRTFPQFMLDRGIIPGIKVDTGAKALAGHVGEVVTEGLDGLRDRLAEYYAMGARFAKWRAVIAIGESTPTEACVVANAHSLARYASLCQEASIVPIVEPEVLMDGNHGLDVCADVTSRVLSSVFAQLESLDVDLEGIILKPNMVIAATGAPEQAGPAEVAERTLGCLRDHVPAAVPGIAFLSGGQADIDATQHLDLMNRLDRDLPWSLTFSFGRALQRPALEIWRGDPAKVGAAEAALARRARLNSLAAQGEYSRDMEEAA